MEITKEKFNEFESVRQSGVTNMFDVPMVIELSGLEKTEVLDIMKNYGKYIKIFGREQ